MHSITVSTQSGKSLSFPSPITFKELVSALFKDSEAIAAKIGDRIVSLEETLDKDAVISTITLKDPDGLQILRHSTAHLMANAIKELWPDAKLAIGPTIEDGFYYDIDYQITSNELSIIEEKMAQIASKNIPIERKILKKEEAIKLFKNEPYKLELLNEIKEDYVTVYQQGNFIDLCRGPHLANTGLIKHFKLMSVAGAYWRGNEKNPMLTRIYGTAFATKNDLDSYIHKIEQALKRDHRKLGPEMKLFCFLPIAPAMPVYLPRGVQLYRTLVEFMRNEISKLDYQEIMAPQLMSSSLWEKSGHLEHFKENMFSFEEEGKITYCLKPMNCPGHIQIYASTVRSYKELPLRFAEFSVLHRNERIGVSHGLFRARAFAQDDGHIFCTSDQIESESISLIDFTFKIYKKFGFDKVTTKLATRPTQYMGDDKNWEIATQALEKSLKTSNVDFIYAHGEGAFYGPKIEFHIEDSLGRNWQCGTIQIDFSMPERFNLEYIDENNKPKRPVMIHRAILGSIERFIGILIENYSGHLPLWLSPVQTIILSITSEEVAYAEHINNTLKKKGIRSTLDTRNEKISYKIREAQIQKIPFMVIVGKDEKSTNTISIRKHTGEQFKNLSLEDFIKLVDFEINKGGTSH